MYKIVFVNEIRGTFGICDESYPTLESAAVVAARKNRGAFSHLLHWMAMSAPNAEAKIMEYTALYGKC